MSVAVAHDELAAAPAEKQKVSADVAFAIAQKFATFLRPRCEKIIIAGSLRRRRALVGDIEILYVPKYVREPDPGDLFGATTLVNTTEVAIDSLLDAGVLGKRRKCDGTLTWGAENKLGVHLESGIAVDLFATTHEKWFNALVVRTGPKASNQEIASAAIARGWRWNAYGAGFTRENPSGAHVVSSEQDAFSFVGLPYKEPWNR